MLARRPHPMLEWVRQIAQRRNRPVAVIALARKLAGITPQAGVTIERFAVGGQEFYVDDVCH